MGRKWVDLIFIPLYDDLAFVMKPINWVFKEK